jgi:uncharacterized protein with HEPN domain
MPIQNTYLPPTYKLDEEFRSRLPQIERRKMACTRDRVINHYFGVDYDIIWDIIENKLPDLQERVGDILDESNQ